MSKRDDRDPPDDDDADDPFADDAPRFTPEEVSAWLARPDVVTRMKAAIGATAGPKTSRDKLEDIYQRACSRALEAEKRPFVGGNTLGWFGRLSSNVTADFFRELSEEEEHLDHSKGAKRQAANLAPVADGDTGEDEGFHPWLAKAVARHDKDRETFELMMRKARDKLTSADIAEIAGITANAYDKRVQALTTKYAPLRKRHLQRRHTLLLLLKLFAKTAIVLAVAAAAWWALHEDDIRRDPDEFRRGRTPPAPSASAPPAPTFDQALPTPAPPQPPPPRLKP